MKKATNDEAELLKRVLRAVCTRLERVESMGDVREIRGELETFVGTLATSTKPKPPIWLKFFEK